MKKLDFVKAAVSFVVGSSATIVVRQIINQAMPSDKVTDRAAALVSGYVLGQIVSEHTKEWTNSKIDETVAKLNEWRGKTKEITPEED